MAWPTSDVNTGNADAATDSPTAFRSDVLDLLTKFNQLRSHVSTLMQSLLNDTTTSQAQSSLGGTTTGKAVFTAASAAAARDALGVSEPLIKATSQVIYETSASITDDLLNRPAFYIGLSAATLTLPAGVTGGATFTLYNVNAGPCTIARGGTTVLIYAQGGSGTSFTLNQGDSVCLCFDGNNWVQVLGSQITTPVGSLLIHTGSSAPRGYLKANGTLLNRTAYANLWDFAQASGNLASSDGAWANGQYSPGDGSTTFRIPDLRGEFLRMWDDGRGIDVGRSLGSAQLDALQGHQHTYTYPETNYVRAGSNGDSPYTPGTRTTAAIVSDGANGTPRIASETRPRNVAYLPCIKF